MAFTGTNDYITGRKPVPNSQGAEVIATRFELDMATADLALNTIGQIGVLPAGHVPVDVLVDADDLDSGAAAMVLQVGIWDGSGASLSVATADGGAHWGVTTAANAAFMQTPDAQRCGHGSGPEVRTDRKLGVKVGTAPTTAVAGKLGVTLLSRVQPDLVVHRAHEGVNQGRHAPVYLENTMKIETSIIPRRDGTVRLALLGGNVAEFKDADGVLVCDIDDEADIQHTLGLDGFYPHDDEIVQDMLDKKALMAEASVSACPISTGACPPKPLPPRSRAFEAEQQEEIETIRDPARFACPIQVGRRDTVATYLFGDLE